MPAIYWITDTGQQALAPIFGLRNFNLHAIINDESGQLQTEAWRRYKLIMALERKYKERIKKEHAEWLKELEKLYNSNQEWMLKHGLDPGLKPLR